MNEYRGTSGEKYQPLSRSKQHLLLPAYRRQCPRPAAHASFLDVACANGVFSPVAEGYRYVGIDLSDVLIERARKEHPAGEYVLGSATELSRHFAPGEFDTVLISMLLPALPKREDLVGVLSEAHTVMADRGTLLLGVTHPSFDWYMQAGLFQRPDVECDFKDYFSSGEPFIIHKDGFDFHDVHWTLADYAEALRASSFTIRTIDECPPSAEADLELIQDRRKFPTYLVLVAQKAMR